MSTCTTKKLYDTIFVVDYLCCHFYCKIWWTSKKLLFFKFKLYCALLSIVHVLAMALMLLMFPNELIEFIELTRVLIESSQVGV
jgi:hypothetical protein